MYYLITYGVKGKTLSNAVVEKSSKENALRVATERAVGVYDDVYGDEDEVIDISLDSEEFDEVINTEINRKVDRMVATAELYETKKHSKLKLTNSNHPTKQQLEKNYY